MAKEKTSLNKKTSSKKSTTFLNNKKKHSITENTKKVKKSTVSIKEEAVLIENQTPSSQISSQSTEKINHQKVKNTRNIFQIYFTGWKNLFSIKGRANRAEFISFWSLSLPILFLLNPQYDEEWINYICSFVSLIVLFGLFTLTIRRTHDLGQRGFWGALLFLLVFGGLNTLAGITYTYAIGYIVTVFLYFLMMLLPGEKSDNRFGKSPKKASKIALILTAGLSLFLLRSAVRLGIVLYEYIYLFI